MPVFPEFKPIEIGDREIIMKSLAEYQPETSELTFTNLFIWRQHYGVMWSQLGDLLLFVFAKTGYGLQPVGRGPRAEAAVQLLNYLKNKYGAQARLERTDKRFSGEIAGHNLVIEPMPGHFDYVYRSEDLIKLAGRKYHSKRNFINSFHAEYQFEYFDMAEEHLTGCMEMAERWCDRRDCEDDISLSGEFEGIQAALNNFKTLHFKGGLIQINGKIEAFTLGEMLNNNTYREGRPGYPRALYHD